MEIVKRIFELSLTEKEARKIKRAMAIVMTPIMVFYMTSMNFLAAEMMRATAQDTVVTTDPPASESSATEKKDEPAKEDSKTEPKKEEAKTPETPAKTEVTITDTAKNDDETDEQEDTTKTIIEAPKTDTVVLAGDKKEDAGDDEKDEVKEATWVIDGKTATISPVELGKTYEAPQNDKVTVTFSKLPEKAGSLTIKEIKLTADEQLVLGALTDTAYDITSDMKNGTFEYDLTLPYPEKKNNEKVKADDVRVLYTEENEIKKEDLKNIDEDENVDKNANDSKKVMEIKGLDHFTIFVVIRTKTEIFPEASDVVVINEFVFDGSEWVEFFNKDNDPVDLTGWKICELTSTDTENCHSLSGSIVGNGFFTKDLSTVLNNDGDTITLKDNSDTIISQVTYDDAAIVNGQNIGDVGSGQSVARTVNGGATWAVVVNPTKNYSNDSTIYVDDSNTTGNEFGTEEYPFNTIQEGIDSVATGGAVNVASGTYDAGFSVRDKNNLNITGDGVDSTIISPSSLITSGIGHKYTANSLVTVLVDNSAGIHISGMTINSNSNTPGSGGADSIVLWNASTGSIDESAIAGTYTINGSQTGQGLGVDAGSGETTTLTVSNTSISGFQKNAIDAVNGNSNGAGGAGTINLTVDDCTIIGNGPTTTIAQNGVLVWNQGGGTVTGTINETTFSGFDYTPDGNEATGVLTYGSAAISSISNSHFDDNEISISAYGGGSIDATSGNEFDGISPSSAIFSELAIIENKLLDKQSDPAFGTVYLLEDTLIATPEKGLQKTIDAASAGDTIKVTAGTYNEKINIDKSLTLNGTKTGVDARTRDTSSDESILDGTGLSGSQYDAIMIANGVSDVVIDGFEIRNYSGSGSNGDGNAISSYCMGADTTGSSNVTVENNYIHDVAYNGILVGSENTAGESMVVQNGWTIQYNKIAGYKYAGVELTNVINSQVRDNNIAAPANIFDDPGDAGVGIEIAARSRAKASTAGTGVEVSGNTITGAFPDGSRAAVNLLSRAYGVTSNATLSGVTVSGNNISGATNTRVAILAVSESRGNGSAAIDSLSIANNVLDGNLNAISIQDYIRDGAGAATHSAITISGNEIKNSTGTDLYLPAPTSTEGITVNSNKFLSNALFGINNEGVNTLDATENWWGTSDALEIVNDVSGDVDYDPWCMNAECSQMSDDVYSETETAALDGSDITVGNLVIEGATGSGNIFVAKYDDPSDVPGGGTAIGAGNFYYNIDAPGITPPIDIEISYSDTDPGAGDYLDENHFVSLYYYKDGAWHDYKLDTLGTTGYDPSNISIDTINNVITAHLQHLTPIVPVVDTTAPSVPVLTSPIGGVSINDNTPLMQWEDSTDTGGSGVAGYEYQVYFSCSDPSNVPGSCSGPYNYGSLIPNSELQAGTTSDNTYYWQVRAKDNIGNFSAWSDFGNVTIDTHAPEKPTGLKFQSQDRTQDFACGAHTPLQVAIPNWDDVTGDSTFDHYEYTSFHPNGNIGLNEQVLTVSELNNSWMPPAEGAYGYAVRSVDKAGNKSDWALSEKTLAGSCQIIYDSTAPAVDLVFSGTGSSVKTFQVVFSEDVNESEAENPANYFLHNWPGAGGSGNLDGHATVSYNSTFHTATVTLTTSGWYISPEQEWGVENIHDLAGNIQSVNPYSEISTAMVDPTDPGTPTSTPNPTNVFTQAWTWLTSTDTGGSGVKGYFWNIYNVIAGTYSGWSWVGNVLGVSTSLLDGEYQLQVKAQDNAGNESGEVNSATLVVDSIPPVITIDSYITTPTNDDITVTASTNEGTLNTTSHTFTANGSFDFVATDDAGNTTTETVTITNIDKDAPVVSITAPVASSVSGIVDIRGSVSDDNPHHYWLAIYKKSNGQNVYSTTVNHSDEFTGRLLYSWNTVGLSDGVYQIKFAERDAADNRSADFVTEVTVDNTAPVIAAHSDETFEATSASGAVVSYISPNVTDNYDADFAATCLPTSGTMFVIGGTLVTCSATDSNGNAAAETTFMVNVVDTTPPAAPNIISSSHILSTWNSVREIDISWNAADLSGITEYSYLWDVNPITDPDNVSEGIDTSVTSTNRPTSQSIYFHIRAKDGAGNWSSTTNYGPFWVDATALTNSWATPLDGAIVAGVVNLQANANDVGSGLKFVRFRYQPLGDAYITIVEDTSSPYSTDWDTTSLADGTYVLRARAEDNSGRANTKDITVTVDNTAPSAAVTYNTTDWTNGDVVATINPSEPVTVTNNSGSATYIFTDNGTFTFEFVDAAGNTGSATAMVSNIDKIIPALSSKTIFSDWYNTTPQTSTFNYTDINMADGYIAPTCDITTEGTSQTCSVMPNICDKAGNCNTATVISNGANIDLTRPESTITSPSDGEDGVVYMSEWNGIIGGTASDNLSGVAGVKLSIQRDIDGVVEYWNGSVWQASEILVDTTGTTSWNYSGLTLPLIDGTYTIKSHALDNAGNQESTFTLTIVLDKTIPTVNLSISPSDPDGDNGWYDSTPEITLSASDKNIDRIEYQIDSNYGMWIVYLTPVKIDNGKHVFYYRSIDKAGNISNIGVKNVKVDTRNPDDVKNLDAEYDEENNAVKLSWDADDSDINEVYIFRGKNKNFSVNKDSRIVKNDGDDEDYTDNDVKRGEKYYYKFVTRDRAGNESDVNIISVKIPEEGGEAIVVDEGTEALPEETVLGEQSEEAQGGQNSETGNNGNQQVAGDETSGEATLQTKNKNWPYMVVGGILIVLAGWWWMRRKKGSGNLPIG